MSSTLGGRASVRLFYEYNFGDGWWHTIEFEKVEPWTDDDPDAARLAK